MTNNLPHNVLEPSTRYLVNRECFLFSFLQVLRNHELVGQIRLDELEARLDGTSQEEGRPVSDIATITHCHEVSRQTQTKTLAEMKTVDEHLQMKDACQSPDPAELKHLEQEDRQRAGTENRPEVAAEEDVNRQPEKKDIQIQENQNKLKPRNSDGNNVRRSSLKERIVKYYEGSPDTRPGLLLKGRMFNDNHAKIEEHILRCVLQLEKDGSAVTVCRQSEVDLPSKAEMKMEAVLEHNHLREYLLLNNCSNNLNNQDGAEVAATASKTSPAEPSSIRIPSPFTIQRHSLPHGGHNGRHEFGIWGASFTAGNDEPVENPGRSEKVEDSCCSENEGLTEEGRLVSCCQEKDQGVDEVTHPNKKPRLEEDGAIKRAENPRDPEGTPQYSES